MEGPLARAASLAGFLPPDHKFCVSNLRATAPAEISGTESQDRKIDEFQTLPALKKRGECNVLACRIQRVSVTLLIVRGWSASYPFAMVR